MTSDIVDSNIKNALIRELMSKGKSIYTKAVGPSMFPIIRSGDKILVDPKAAMKLDVGDIVMYQKDGCYIIHRLIKNIDPSMIITRGDNLSCNDSPVPTENIMGKVVQIEGHGRRIILTRRPSRIFARVIAWLARGHIRGKSVIIRHLGWLWLYIEGRRIV